MADYVLHLALGLNTFRRQLNTFLFARRIERIILHGALVVTITMLLHLIYCRFIIIIIIYYYYYSDYDYALYKMTSYLLNYLHLLLSPLWGKQ